ncbi:hypothetical protein BpHYR1_024112 [Brachionus plicatilis]|uniref:Uncharacterized protein n=1 Tax=Brachionus plicatilis TaxID=10195 RepID=A0A3M7PVK4_BRAPC|nr:hypothetical protein BpHYR1_024112 [Brachionus plicatilis]
MSFSFLILSWTQFYASNPKLNSLMDFDVISLNFQTIEHDFSTEIIIFFLVGHKFLFIKVPLFVIYEKCN